MRALGIEPVLGTLSDATVLAQAARAADAVINAANADDRGAGKHCGCLEGSGKIFSRPAAPASSPMPQAPGDHRRLRG